MTPTRDRVARVPTLIVHGGAGANPDEGLEELRDGVRAALRAGWRVLAADGRALDAVEAAVRVLEDHPRFNAGRGSVLTEAGTVEMDASIMEGDRLSIVFDGERLDFSNPRTGETLTGRALPPIMLEILDAGGLVPYIRRHGGFSPRRV